MVSFVNGAEIFPDAKRPPLPISQKREVVVIARNPYCPPVGISFTDCCDRNMYLVNRDNLGGISAPIAVSLVASSTILQVAVTYRTGTKHLCGVTREQRWQHGSLSAFRITPTDPPTIASGWNVSRGAGGCGSPFCYFLLMAPIT